MVNKIFLVCFAICFAFIIAGTMEVSAEKTFYLHNYSLNISHNITAMGYCNVTDCYGIDEFLEGGWTSTALTDLDMAGYRLTDVGEIVMSGAIQGQDILPSSNMTYALGNITDWFLNIYVGNVNALNISSTNLNSTNIDSININSTNLDSTNIKSDEMNISNNLTIGGTKITVIDNVTYYKSVN